MLLSQVYPTGSPIDKVLDRLGGVRKQGAGYKARCPAHDDRKASLSVSIGDDGEKVLLHCFAGCDREDILQKIGLHSRDLFPPKVTPLRSNNTRQSRAPIVATYDYVRDGELVFQVERLEPKSFRQRRPDGNGGWEWSMKGVERCLYHHDEVVKAAGPVYYCEGEKDSDRLRSLGLIATTAAGGANGKWLDSYAEVLAGKDVVILPHNDEPGRKRGQQVAGLLHGVAESVRVADLAEAWPELPPHGDVSDFLDIFTADDFIDFIAEMPEWTPEDTEILSVQTLKGIGMDRKEMLFRTPADMAASGSMKTEWLARGIVARGNVTELVGKIKTSGKTTFALAMVKAILEGKTFVGHACAKSPVVYLSEQGDSSMLCALERANLIDAEGLHILSWHMARKLSWPQTVAMAAEYAASVGAGLLVIDTLGRWAGISGDNENNAGAAGEIMEPLKMASASLNLAVLTLRHGRKSGGDVGDDGRGSSAFGGDVDIMLSLRRPEGNHSDRPSVRELQGVGRFDETPEKVLIELKGEQYVLLGDESAIAHAEARTAVLDVLPTSEADAMQEADIIEASKATRSTAKRVLREYVESGRVVRTGKGRKGDPVRYWLPEILSVQTSDLSWTESNGHNPEEPPGLFDDLLPTWTAGG